MAALGLPSRLMVWSRMVADDIAAAVFADADAHDWWNMLGMLGLRAHASAIGGTISAVGWGLQAAAPAWAVSTSS